MRCSAGNTGIWGDAPAQRIKNMASLSFGWQACIPDHGSAGWVSGQHSAIGIPWQTIEKHECQPGEHQSRPALPSGGKEV